MNCFTVLLLVSLFVNYGGTARTKRDIIFDETCIPTNCSQPAREYQGDNRFVCGIGHQTECELAHTRNYGSKTENRNTARLGFVHLYGRTHKDYKHGEYRSLNLSIVLPNYDEEALKVRMIALNFYSPEGPYMDEYYHNYSRCRLFYFHKTVLTKVDLEHPREIPYPCLVGLSESSSRHLYVVNLTVYPYDVSTAYHLVTYSYIYGEHCISASAIALISPSQRIHVVFDSVHTMNWFRLLLYKDNEVLETVNITGHNQYEFALGGAGVYKVGMEHLPDEKHYCGMVFTHEIVIQEERTPASPQIYVIAGLTVAAFVLFVVIVVCIFRMHLSPSNIILKLSPSIYNFVCTTDIERMIDNVAEDDSDSDDEPYEPELPIDVKSRIKYVRYNDE